MTLEEYKEYIEYLSINNVDRIFLNSSCDHAAIVLTEIFNKAKRDKTDLCIFAGDLNNDACRCDEYKNALYDCIENGISVRILLNNYNKNESNEIIENLRKLKVTHQNIEVFITKAEPTIEDKEKTYSKKIHFTLSGNSYRLETDIISNKSTCNFNDSVGANKILTCFNSIWNSNPESVI